MRQVAAIHSGRQHRTQFVRGTRWWPPFCAAVDFVVAAVLFVEIAAGLQLHG